MGLNAKDTQSLFAASPGSRRFAPRQAVSEPPTWCPLAVGAVVLCIDPSIANCGWAIVRNTQPNPERLDSGIFHPVTRADLNRFDHLSQLIQLRVDMCNAELATPFERVSTESKPERITDALIETPVGGGGWGAKTTSTLMMYTRAIGVCEATCLMLGLRVHRVAVNEWKGSGKKSTTALHVRHFLNYEPRDSNESDALGMGLWICGRTQKHPN